MGKPARDCFQLAAQTLAKDVTRCLVFDDAAAGIMAAEAAGASVIVVTETHAHPRHFAHATTPNDIGLRHRVVGENDTLDVRSTLTHLSGTRVESRHIVGHRDRLVADVAMTSVFVRRQTGGVNRSIARVHIEGAHRVSSVFDRHVEASVKMHNGRPASESKQDEVEVGAVSVEPCPHLDFNGAGLLYFSIFIAAVDRAEWRLIGKSKGLSSVKERRAVFHSNIEIGDDLVVQILAARGEGASEHRSQVFASSDGRLLAEVFTQKGPL